jgi:hypothetical protein
MRSEGSEGSKDSSSGEFLMAEYERYNRYLHRFEIIPDAFPREHARQYADPKAVSITDRIDPEELLVASDLLESNGFEDSAEVLRNAYSNLMSIRATRDPFVMSARHDPRPVLPRFNLGAISVGLGEKLTGDVDRQARELARRLERWLIQIGVTNENASDYRIEQLESRNVPHMLVYELRRLDGSFASRLEIDRMSLQ